MFPVIGFFTHSERIYFIASVADRHSLKWNLEYAGIWESRNRRQRVPSSYRGCSVFKSETLHSKPTDVFMAGAAARRSLTQSCDTSGRGDTWGRGGDAPSSYRRCFISNSWTSSWLVRPADVCPCGLRRQKRERERWRCAPSSYRRSSTPNPQMYSWLAMRTRLWREVLTKRRGDGRAIGRNLLASGTQQHQCARARREGSYRPSQPPQLPIR